MTNGRLLATRGHRIHSRSLRVRITLSEGPGGVVVGAEVVVGLAEVGAVEGAAVFGALVLVVV